jgi:hypothetical protein
MISLGTFILVFIVNITFLSIHFFSTDVTKSDLTVSTNTEPSLGVVGRYSICVAALAASQIFLHVVKNHFWVTVGFHTFNLGFEAQQEPTEGGQGKLFVNS